MRKVIDRLLQDTYDCERAENRQADMDDRDLDISCLNLELSLKQGETVEGSFIILAPRDGFMEGIVYSSEIRMECLNREFAGVREEITYRFDTIGMEEGDVSEGRFSIISNYGEYELPYRIEIESSVITSSLGTIKNMFHFANLAKANWEEAVQLFYSKEFEKIFASGNDSQYYNSFKGLSAVYGNEQNMEEFLLEINKKQRIEYIPEVMEICIEDPVGISGHSLKVVRNGWGHTFLNIRAEGEFLKIEQETVSDDEFLGNSYRLVFYIDSELLHAGRNFGGIHIYNSYVDITIMVTVVRNMERKRMLGIRKEKKRMLVQLMEYYEAFRTKRISTRTWMSETEKLVERMLALDEKDIQTRLFQVQLLITQERYNEAKWQMERIKEEIKEADCPKEIWCYCLYLTTLYSREEFYIEETAKQVERAYYANKDNWRIGWLMLYLSEEYGRSPSKRWLILEEQHRRNCISPVLYVEAWHLLELNPTLLMKLNSFELQILNFAAKRELITQEMIVQIRYLVMKLKNYSERAFCILRECYEKYPDNETLQAICTLLIKGNKTDSSYFKWYSLGVKQEIRITKLYEYYMMSLPIEYEDDLPRMVLMYFAYHSELDYRKNAFLFAYVCKRKNEQPELYLSYCEQIERFVLEQAQKGRITKDLAYLYQHVIVPEMMNEELAGKLVNLIFMNCVQTFNKDVRQIIVKYAISKDEYIYPVSGMQAWIPMYGSDYKILLEDGNRNRYSISMPYKTERMMTPEKLIAMISPYITNYMGLDIFMCESDRFLLKITKENARQFQNIAMAEHVEEDARREIRLKLVHYYYEQDYMRELDEYLEELSPEDMGSNERNEVIRFMVIRGMYDKAFAWVGRFGLNGVEVKTVVRLCSRLISRDGFIEDEKMTYAVYYAFRKGKYDGNLLTYLVYFYNDMIKRMRDVWNAAVAFEIETYDLCERILGQMLFSGAFIGERMEIFKQYVSGGAKAPLEKVFLSRCSYDYFVKDKLVDAFICMDIMRVYERGEKPDKVSKLAFLKYYSENKEEITPKVRSIIKFFLYDAMEDNIYFSFFKEYVEEISMMEQFADKTMIEYKVQTGGKAVIHYIIERGRGTGGEYRQEEMRNMYGGVCVKAFVLFFGEKLQYYITEEAEGKEQLTESDSIGKSDIRQRMTENKFNIINDIVIGKTLQDYNTVDSLMEEYYRKEYMTSQIFHLR